MKGLLPIVIALAVLAAVPAVVHSNVVLNFLVVTLMIALAGQGWNILGGYGNIPSGTRPSSAPVPM